MAITCLLLGALLPFFKFEWPTLRRDYLHISIVGLLIHGVYLGGVFAAIHNHLPASVTAIIMGLQPLVTVLIATCWLRESLTRGKIIGLALGFAGVVLVVGHQGIASGGVNRIGIVLCCIAVTAISVGTTYQKKFCGNYHLLPTIFIQFIVNAVCLGALALMFESRTVTWDARFIFALTWLVLVLSVGTSFLLLWLIRHGEAGKVGSLFYLVPPLVAVEAWVLFGETLGLPAIAGIIACMAGVAIIIKDSNSARASGTFLSQAYALKNNRDIKKFYRKWAKQYDRQMHDQLHYCSPRLIVERMRRHLPDQRARILDIGCGTGLTIQGLAEAGYVDLHGLDLSAEMIEVARRRGIYSSLRVGDVNRPLDYADGYFAGVISSGTFTHGHVGPAPLDEICRIMAERAILACTVHKDLWESMAFDAAFDRLVQNRTLKLLSLELDRFYENREPEGWFCVYQKLPG